MRRRSNVSSRRQPFLLAKRCWVSLGFLCFHFVLTCISPFLKWFVGFKLKLTKFGAIDLCFVFRVFRSTSQDLCYSESAVWAHDPGPMSQSGRHENMDSLGFGGLTVCLSEVWPSAIGLQHGITWEKLTIHGNIKGNTGIYPPVRYCIQTTYFNKLEHTETICSSSSLGFHLPKGMSIICKSITLGISDLVMFADVNNQSVMTVSCEILESMGWIGERAFAKQWWAAAQCKVRRNQRTKRFAWLCQDLQEDTSGRCPRWFSTPKVGWLNTQWETRRQCCFGTVGYWPICLLLFDTFLARIPAIACQIIFIHFHKFASF